MVLFVACSLGFGTWTALAAVVTTTDRPLPGSEFQGGDGDQDDAVGLIDWQGFQASAGVEHTSDPNAQDNVFHGGSKELSPDGWGLTTQNGGSNPASGNIVDFYRAIDHPVGGDVFLYLAFAREASNGTVFVTFELNQDARLWTNSRGARIPCRTTGDILISFEPHGNGASVDVERWVTDRADPTTGCAINGSLQSASNLKPGVDVQGSFNNDSTIHNYLPGFYAATTPKLNFGEAAINLSSVLSDIGHPCGAFDSAWMYSLSSSSSESADMKDYVVPSGIAVRTCKASPDLSSASSGSVDRKARGKHRGRRHRMLRASASISDTAHLSGVVDPTGTITFWLYGPDDATCARPAVFSSTSTAIGDGYYQSGSFVPATAGMYRWVVDYSGDQNNSAARPTACGDSSETVVVSRASPGLSSLASGALGRRHARGGTRRRVARARQGIYDTAVLSGGVSPAGTLTFRLYGPDDTTCSGGAIFTSRVAVQANGAHNSGPFTPTAAGTYRWVARYSGDRNNEPVGPTGCGTGAETVVISPAQPAISTLASIATVLGNPIRDRATLSNGSDPGGKIKFAVYGPDDRTCTGQPAATSTVDVSGSGTYPSQSFMPTAMGTIRWVASYSGDANNRAAGPTTCSDPAEEVVV